MSTFAISDIHGRLTELELLLSLIECNKTDEVVFLGDYIDRGPSSKQVIDKLIHIKESMPRSRFLKGNHEDMALFSRKDTDAHMFWLKYGGDKTLESYNGEIPDSHWDFIERLDLYYETNDSIFVHAGLSNELDLKDQDEETLIWNRLSAPISHTSNKKIFCGHSSQRSGYPILYGSARCIDCSGWLSAINTETDTVYQVNHLADKRIFQINEH